MAPVPTPPADPEFAMRLTIGSRLELLSMVHALLEGIGRQFSLAEEWVQAVQIAVIEAGTNAIQHGNVFAEDKSVTFDFRLEDDALVVEVDDYGKGFDPKRVGDPTDPSALLNPSGRGVYLMRELMDDVSFETRPDHGTRVVLKKARPAPSR
ncbi:MAG: ATP-binding protein [Hyphomicrobiales bacterium]